MKPEAVSILAPFSASEFYVLRAYVTGEITPKSIAVASPAEAVARATAEQSLASRGFLQKLAEPKRTKGAAAYVVTPEGLACALGSVPIEDLMAPAHAAG